MKRVMVAVKRVVDYNARIRVKADKVRVDHFRCTASRPLLHELT